MPHGSNSSAIDQIVEIVVQADPAAAQHLRAELQQLEAQMKAIAQTGVAAGKSTAEVGAEVAALTQKAALARQMLAQLEGGLANTGSAASHASRGVLALSQGLEDLTTGGPIGILNNIPMMFEGVGRAAGMSVPQVNMAVAGVTALATGAYILYRNWDQFAQTIGLGTTKTEAEHMEELGKQTAKTAAETEKLLKYEERRKTVEAQRTAKTDVEKEQETRVNDAMIAAGPDADKAIVRGLVQTGKERLTGMSDEARDADREVERYIHRIGADREGMGGKSAAERRADAFATDPFLQQRQAVLETKLDEAARKLMAEAAHDPGKLQALIAMTQGSKAASFPRNLSRNLYQALPGAIEEEREGDAAAEANEEANEARIKSSKEAAKKRAEAVAQAKQSQRALEAEQRRRIADKERRAVDDIRDRIRGVTQDFDLSPEQKIAALKGIQGSDAYKALGADARDPLEDKIKTGIVGAAKKFNQDQARAQKDAERAEAKVEKGHEAEAARLQKGFGPQIEHAVMSNMRAAMMGQPHHDQAALVEDITRRVQFDLAQTGNNPDLAQHIVGQSLDDVQRRVTRAQSTNANAFGALSQAQHSLETELMQSNARIQRVEMQAAQLNNRVRRGGGMSQRRGPDPIGMN
jgi:hypothetical protein